MTVTPVGPAEAAPDPSPPAAHDAALARVRWRRPRVSRPGVALSFAFLLVLVVAAIWPGLFTGTDPNAADIAQTLRGPGAGHLLGTDQNGRDILARIVHGTRPSLWIGLSASALALVVGTAIGVAAAQGGRVVAAIADWVLNVIMSIPGLLLALLVIAVLGPGTRNSIIGLSLILLPGFARVVRGEVLRIRASVYLEAARALGWRQRQVIVRHLVPNALGPVLILATIGVGAAIGLGSTLSFLGLGPQPPTAEWGAMLASSRTYFAVAWWPAIFPGIVITLTVLTITVAGRFLQARLEGRDAR